MFQSFIAAITVLVTAVAWAIRLEGRVNLVEKVNEEKHVQHDEKYAALQKTIGDKFKDQKDYMTERLDRLEDVVTRPRR